MPAHANVDVVGAIIKKHAGNVFYDAATHGVVRLEEEVSLSGEISLPEEKPRRKRKKK